MNILNQDVLNEKLQKKPNKSYIQKVQQFNCAKKPMSFLKFKETGRKMKPSAYLKNYYKSDISITDMGLVIEKDASAIYRYVGGFVIQELGKNFYMRYYNNFNSYKTKSEAEKFLYEFASELLVFSYAKDPTNQQ
mgnify:CR=1 FL=1|tara:strand:+ start:1360 stop:1764 length:405 start_codon:yes stop_codon:yes gene_type:complete